jgi:hypothetical protein
MNSDRKYSPSAIENMLHVHTFRNSIVNCIYVKLYKRLNLKLDVLYLEFSNNFFIKKLYRFLRSCPGFTNVKK